MPELTLDDIRSRVAGIRSWQRGDEVAPHKPLLLLYALGRLQVGKARLVAFAEARQPLAEMLREFGPYRRSFHPEYPFQHLCSDRLWELKSERPIHNRKGNSNASGAELIRAGAEGGLPQDVFTLLRKHPDVVGEVASLLLTTNFAESLHSDILATVGLAVYTGSTTLKRDPAFRELVLDAYGRACAVCGFDARLGMISMAVEAAHIRWHQHGGPSSVRNGLCLCSTHHKVFDLGGFTVTTAYLVEVADKVVTTPRSEAWLWAFDGKELRLPRRAQLAPEATYLEWHRREVFKQAE